MIGVIFFSCFYGRLDVACGFVPNVASASMSEEEETLQQELEEEVDKQLGNLDFSGIEAVVEKLSTSAKEIFSARSFLDKLQLVISGEYADNSENFLNTILSVFFSGMKGYLPIIASIVAVSILGGMIANLKPATNGKSIGNIVHFVTYGVVIVFLGTSIVQILQTTTTALTSTKELFDAIFPILLTLLTAVGGSVSVGIYQPAIALISNVIISFITYILLPMFIFSIVFSIVGNLSNNVRLDKFVAFLHSAFKWIIGLCFTIFLGFISIQGVMAGAVDGLSIRTAKYAIKSYIPIVGGYVSDGFSIIMASSMLIKNAVGGVGLFLLLSTVASPVINIVIFMLALKFMAGIIEPIGDKKIATFASEISKSLSLLVALLVAVSFMYLVLTGLIMCSANLVI
ncbi:MAG: stage III sporulation protein AE [Clostridia bacterium]|nr:stage III sporulation protein AE [Clostridia bacterium]